MNDESAQTGDFTLVLDGPLYRVYRRLHLLSPPLDLLHRRIFAVTALAWAPLLLLTLLRGEALGGVATPFLKNIATQIRFLIVLPLLLSAETTVHQRLRSSVLVFVERNLIPPEERSKFSEAILSAARWRNSTIAEVLLLIAACTLGNWVWYVLHLDVATWYADGSGGLLGLTPAGFWYVFISLTLFRFLIFRWLYRIFIWHRFLWQISRIRLNLDALHPDRACGLGFIGTSAFSFGPVLISFTALLSGKIADYIFHQNAKLMDFEVEVAAFILLCLVIALVSQLFFIFPLMKAKRTARREYGTKASLYIQEFHQKWLEDKLPEGETFMGSADIQSLADLGNSYAVVRQTRIIPISPKQVVSLAIILLIPIAPLMLTMMPLAKIVELVLSTIL